jgi:hypothetical protein
MAKISRAATPMANRVSVSLPATSHAQSFGRWLRPWRSYRRCLSP